MPDGEMSSGTYLSISTRGHPIGYHMTTHVIRFENSKSIGISSAVPHAVTSRFHRVRLSRRFFFNWIVL